MKKSLLALAAMGAFAGAAQAQSSVTVYGILDLGYVGGTEKGTVAGRDFSRTGNQFGGIGSQSTNRLGFRGTEDLGGGTRAFFTLENSITADGNSIWGTSGTGNRQAFVGLGQKGLGQFAVGTQYTPLFNNASATSPGQFNNVMGDVIYAANSSGTFTNTADSLSRQNAASGANIGFTVRTANMLRIDTDSFAGFRFQGFITMDNQSSPQTAQTATSRVGGNNNRSGWGLGANYTWQKLFVAANYQSLKADNPYATLATSTEVFGAAANTGLNVKDNQWFVGATYDFGVVKAYAQYINRKATSEIAANDYISRTAQQLGVRGNFTKTIEGWASFGNGRYRSFGANQPTVNFSGWQVGSNYWLSKRTNLYAIYGASNTSSSSVSGSYNGSQYAVGARHTF